MGRLVRPSRTEGRFSVVIDSCPEMVSCPRCAGCGYPDCRDCESLREAKRPGCWRCGGSGLVPCQSANEEGHLCSTKVEVNGEMCSKCDQPTPPGDDGCPRCWVSLDGMPLADMKALFAASDLSLEKKMPEGY